MLEESHQSSTFFFVSSSFYLALNTCCWPRRKTRKIEKFHCLCCYQKHVHNTHIYPTHLPFSYTSRLLIRSEPDFGQQEPIERDKLCMFLESASQARNPFIQQHTTQQYAGCLSQEPSLMASLPQVSYSSVVEHPKY